MLLFAVIISPADGTRNLYLYQRDEKTALKDEVVDVLPMEDEMRKIFFCVDAKLSERTPALQASFQQRVCQPCSRRCGWSIVPTMHPLG